jgi:His/Glu/Gln/Arg/opine family amino acid ABC transporter permease subunit
MKLDFEALFDPSQVLDNVDVLLEGALTTLQLSALSVVFAAMVGVLLSVLRSSPWLTVRGATRIYIELIRGTPLLVQMYILYYGLPSMGITLSPMTAAALALAQNSGAYVGEILRTAIAAVPKAQGEASRAVGMGYLETQFRIIYPQALPIALPSLMGEVIDIVKWSAIGSIVVVPEATQVVTQIVAQSYRGFAIMFLSLALFYLVLTGTLALASRWLEKRLTRHRIKLIHA